MEIAKEQREIGDPGRNVNNKGTMGRRRKGETGNKIEKRTRHKQNNREESRTGNRYLREKDSCSVSECNADVRHRTDCPADRGLLVVKRTGTANAAAVLASPQCPPIVPQHGPAARGYFCLHVHSGLSLSGEIGIKETISTSCIGA